MKKDFYVIENGKKIYCELKEPNIEQEGGPYTFRFNINGEYFYLIITRKFGVWEFNQSEDSSKLNWVKQLGEKLDELGLR
jgi:hypothetical protein